MLDRGSSEFNVCYARYITSQAVSPSLIGRSPSSSSLQQAPHTPQSLHTVSPGLLRIDLHNGFRSEAALVSTRDQPL